MASQRILATGFGALLVLYALTAAWIVVDSDTDSVGADTLRLESGSITLERDGAAVTVAGTVASTAAGEALVNQILDAGDVSAVIDRLLVDAARAIAPDVSAITEFADAGGAP